MENELEIETEADTHADAAWFELHDPVGHRVVLVAEHGLGRRYDGRLVRLDAAGAVICIYPSDQLRPGEIHNVFVPLHRIYEINILVGKTRVEGGSGVS